MANWLRKQFLNNSVQIIFAPNEPDIFFFFL